MIGDKPLVQVKPKGTKAGTKEAAAKPAAAPKGKPQSIAARLQACLDLDDGTKDRLNCYDAVIPPAAKAESRRRPRATPIAVSSRKRTSGQACFNGFAESVLKLPKT